MATKTAPKKSSSKTVKKESPVSTPEIKPSTSQKKEKTQHNINALGIIAIIFIFLFSLFIFKRFFVAASVNGQPISRFAIYNALEKQAGKQTLDNLITKTLIIQEAKKRNIVASDNDINSEIETINKSLTTQGTTLDKALAAQGMTRNQLVEELRVKILLTKMIGEVKPTDKEIQEFIESNKDQFPEGTTEAQIKEQAVIQLNQQKLQLATQNFIKNLQDNSKTIYFVRY